ncbi:Spi family protease inhibitor [Aequorivita flava]|uniref:Spi family protease inhibitor n=1 Tax=Aequorivita flava TaxID=3114371 RepID=A0AB35YU21_9FLAO
MRIKSQILQHIFILLFIFTLASCQREESSDQLPLQTKQIENFINQSKASTIATEFVFDIKSKNANGTTYSKKEVAEITPIADETKKNVFYIVNYKEGGFAIIAADNRSIPILAFDDNGNPIGAAHYLYYRMNWGWGGQYNNAWYANNNFNPGSNTFNYQKKMIYNIKS